MSGLPSLRYPHARHDGPAPPWARDWRVRWFRYVGSVHQHHQSGELVAFYSDERDSGVRLQLQRELEARTSGVAQVLAACREVARDWDRAIEASARRLTHQIEETAR